MTTKKSISDYIKYVSSRTYDLEKRQKKDVTVSVIFIQDGKSIKKIDNEKRSSLSMLRQMIEFDTPEKVITEIYTDGGKTVYPRIFYEKKRQETTKNDEKRKITENNDEKRQKTTNNGLGEIEEIVNKRLEEERKHQELIQLKRNLDELQQQIIKKDEEIKQLQQETETLQEENEQLERELENKKSIKYYANFAGDILESIGIPKKSIKAPIAQLMGIEDEKQLAGRKPTDDNSGIVEEKSENKQASSENNRRKELIELITEYLKTTDNNTLTNIFSIFSDIEENKKLSFMIVKYLEELKQNNK